MRTKGSPQPASGPARSRRGAAQGRPASTAGLAGSWPYPRLVAHRGAGRLVPENTLASMRAGRAHGYRMVEFDVKLSADGVAFLLHDTTLERTTDGRGRADALPWRELSRLDAGSWHSPRWAGEPLPTLAAVARWARAEDVCCNVEIKPTEGRERETGAAVAFDAAELWRGAAVPPLLSSFSEVALAAAREAAPALPRALLCDDLPADWLERVRKLDCAALDARHDTLSPEIVRTAHAAGRRVLCWTPNEPARIAELAAWGVDAIITDAVDRVAADAIK